MTDKQKKLDKVFINIAKQIATLSYCERAKVGAIIVRDGNIISMGFNGMPAKMPNCCERKGADGKLVTYDEVLHAESNALLKSAKMGLSTDGATMYCTLSPCKECAKLIIQSGIDEVIYNELFYRDNGTVEFLKNYIKIKQYDEY